MLEMLDLLAKGLAEDGVGATGASGAAVLSLWALPWLAPRDDPADEQRSLAADSDSEDGLGAGRAAMGLGAGLGLGTVTGLGLGLVGLRPPKSCEKSPFLPGCGCLLLAVAACEAFAAVAGCERCGLEAGDTTTVEAAELAVAASCWDRARAALPRCSCSRFLLCRRCSSAALACFAFSKAGTRVLGGPGLSRKLLCPASRLEGFLTIAVPAEETAVGAGRGWVCAARAAAASIRPSSTSSSLCSSSTFCSSSILCSSTSTFCSPSASSFIPSALRSSCLSSSLPSALGSSSLSSTLKGPVTGAVEVADCDLRFLRAWNSPASSLAEAAWLVRGSSATTSDRKSAIWEPFLLSSRRASGLLAGWPGPWEANPLRRASTRSFFRLLLLHCDPANNPRFASSSSSCSFLRRDRSAGRP
mmetsp:Transcript_26119/g.36004  ORF Transcript_26119/g.36004 Transcript_26119/m.36004 type:complete len:416 (-) Transcript_26119:509-1756(-)